MPYSASEMFVTHGIPSFYELLRKFIYNFSERIRSSRNSITEYNGVYTSFLYTNPWVPTNYFTGSATPI